jgi:hypothetical protein
MRGQRLRVIGDAAPAGGKSKHGGKRHKGATATALGAGKPAAAASGKALAAAPR